VGLLARQVGFNKVNSMEAQKSAVVPVRTHKVALDFLMLAGMSVISGLTFAAAASAVVILLTAGG
jgi:hypothetical protein